MIQSRDEKRAEARKAALERAKRIREERKKSGRWVPIDSVLRDIDERRGQ